MKNKSDIYVCCFAVLAPLILLAHPLPVKVVTVADHADARYRCGEVAVFTAEALGPDGERLTNGVLRASVDNFGLRTIAAERTVDLAKENPFVLRGSRATPGFLRLNVAAADDRLKVVANAGQREYAFGVGYEPERIAPGTPEPADEVDAWQNGAPEPACGDASSTVPVGRSVTDVLVDARRYYPGSQFEYCAWAPDDVRTNAAVYVILEHACKADRLRPAIFGMMADGRVPPGIVVIWHGGGLPRGPKKDQPGRLMRASQLDQPGTEFPNLLVEEVVPDAARRLGVTIHPSPDFHFITGGSSGGLAAWNAAWFRNDFFHRTYLSSPTFSAMRGGEEPMTIVRKCETRPLRIYMTVGTVEPDYYFGDSFLVALNAASAFRHAGYDYRFEVFEHEGHCARREDPDLWSRMLPWLFEGWRTNATVVAKGNPPRVRMLLSPGSAWEPCDFTMPAPRREVVSTDGWRVYSVAPDSRFVMSEELRTDGSRTNRYVLSNLHLAWNARQVGGTALALLEDDRVLVATELGVQGVVSFGITDLVLPLPGDLPADNVAVVGRTLYAASGAKVFRRELAKPAADPTKRVAPSSPGYGDGPYVHEHLPIPEVVRP